MTRFLIILIVIMLAGCKAPPEPVERNNKVPAGINTDRTRAD